MVSMEVAEIEADYGGGKVVGISLGWQKRLASLEQFDLQNDEEGEKMASLFHQPRGFPTCSWAWS